MEKKSGQKNKIQFMVMYTCIFSLLAVVLHMVMSLNGKSFVWYYDGMAQHIVALKYIRNWFISLFTSNKAVLVDFSLGQGFDVIGTLNYYGLGDPVMLLSVLFPESALELCYEFLIFVRLYLSGIFFAYFCKVVGKTNVTCVLPAALLYAFCNFALMGGIRHPFFINGIIYLPFILAGVEKIMQKKSIRVLCIAVAFGFLTNYYFMYMNTIMAAMYYFIRQIGSYKENGISVNIRYMFKIALSYIWGAAMSAIILFPSVYAFLNNPRTDSISQKTGFVYNTAYYKRLFENMFISNNMLNNWCVPGIGVIGMLALAVVIFRNKKSENRLVITFIIGMIMMCLPFVGKMMNGFAYVTNRFSYGMAFLLAFMVVCAIQDLKEMGLTQYVIITVIALTALEYCVIRAQYSDKKIYMVTFLLILLTLICCLAYAVTEETIKSKIVLKILPYSLTFATVICVSVNFVTVFDKKYGNYAEQFIDKNKVEETMNSGTMQMLKSVDDDSFYRTERDDDHWNRDTFYNINGTNFYYSVLPKDLYKLYLSVGLPNFNMACQLTGLSGRTALESLASVKYYATYDDVKNVPYGFEKIKEQTIDGRQVYLYENKNYLPIGITYDTYMTKAQYNNLNTLEREQALLTCAITVKDVEGIENYKGDIKGITYESPKIENGKIKLQDNKIYAKKDKDLKITFNGNKNAMTYLVFDKLFVKDASKDKMPAVVKTDRSKTKLRVVGKSNKNYFKTHAHAIDLGQFDGEGECKVHFNVDRTYKYEKIYIGNVSLKDVDERINKLKQETLEDVSIENNKITGNITCSSNKILQLSVPYSKGYTAYVDGKKAKVIHSGIGYMGIVMEKGSHSVEVRYISPYLKKGIVVSSASICAFLIFGIYGIIRTLSKKKKA